MNSIGIRTFALGVAAIAAGIYAQTGSSVKYNSAKNDPVAVAVGKGIQWLVSVQGKDGGWGQDGGETTYIRQGERLESKGNDVANTAIAAEALLRAGNTPTIGEHRDSLRRALNFILEHVEQSPTEGLAVTDVTGTQIQRKLGPYIETFLTSKLFAELDGNMGSMQANARLRRSLQKCIAKIEQHQLKDGSWNIAGGWAPILGTSMASRSLHIASQKGVEVKPMTLAKVAEYTQRAPSVKADSGVAGGVVGGIVGGVPGGVYAAAAGVPLYQSAQELEQLSRTAEDRKKNAPRIDVIKSRLSDARFVTGFGSIGGEEFFSYLNISDSLRRSGGPEWQKWNTDITAKILKMQNNDGTWAGHHCITGRVAVTSAAILTLLADREPAILMTRSKKN